MVQLEIRVTGAGEASTPAEISVDGLEIHPTGTSRQFEMHNFTTSSSVTYNYTVLPLKPGTFTIPPQTIRVGTTSLRTPELRLAVVGSPSGGSARSNPSNPNLQAVASKIAFAELIVGKKSAYVGEMVPVEIRLGLPSRTRAKLIDGPEIAGQGFTTQKLQAPDLPHPENINGRSYDVYTFKTAIAAARPGKFDVGPAEATALVVVPRHQNKSRSRSPFDLFNLDDPFSDPFFTDPFGTFGQQEKLPIKSEAATLEVKPLPANAPPNFSGAVGNFSMAVEANPKNVEVGDPITVTATITGRGNFDRVNAPALEDEHGWHKYPPSSKFKQDDDVGISGAKIFETVFSPNEKKQGISPFVFSFFDPAKENYVTLRSDVIPVRVEGGSGASAAATPAPAPTVATSTSSPGAKPTPKPQDILDQLTERSARAQSFTPLYARRPFWLAQIVPLLALLGFIGWKVRQSRLGDREGQRISALHHEAAELVRKLRRDDASPQTYFSQAARAVQVKTALVRNVDPNTVDLETTAATFQLDENSRDQLRRLFERSDELRYSGVHNGAETISAEHRRQLLDLIESLKS